MARHRCDISSKRAVLSGRNDADVGPTSVVNGPTSLGRSPARTRKFKPKPDLHPKINLNPKLCPKNANVKLDLKNLTMLPSYFDYIFVHLKQKARLRPELSPKVFSTLGPNPTRKARPDLLLWAPLP